MSDRLVYAGLTHQSAPVAIRERFHQDRESRRALLDGLARVASEQLVLDTCGRYEIYAVTDVSPAELAAAAGLDRVPSAYIRTATGDDCARHALNVAAGLESQILGERQIVRQIRDAYLAAADARAVGPILSKLFQTAIHTGKRVRVETGIGAHAMSCATLAVDFLRARSVDLARDTVLVLGSGRIAADTVDALHRAGSTNIILIGRNIRTSGALSERKKIVAYAWEQLPGQLADASGLIVCTAAPAFIVKPRHIGQRNDRPLCAVDLSVPRNIDPAVARIEGVTLRHLDELLDGAHRIAPNMRAARSIVESHWQKFERWRRVRTNILQSRANPQAAAA